MEYFNKKIILKNILRLFPHSTSIILGNDLIINSENIIESGTIGEIIDKCCEENTVGYTDEFEIQRIELKNNILYVSILPNYSDPHEIEIPAYNELFGEWEKIRYRRVITIEQDNSKSILSNRHYADNVQVFNYTGKQISPISPANARKKICNGEAVVVCENPYAIQLIKKIQPYNILEDIR